MENILKSKIALSALVVPGFLTGCMLANGAQQSSKAPRGNGASPSKRSASALRVASIERREEVLNGVQSDSGLTVPRGFKISVFAEGLDNPRRLAIAPNAAPSKYDVFVAESKPNRVSVLRDANGDGSAETKSVFSDKFKQPYGLAFHPDGWLYVANTNSVVRLPYQSGQIQSNAAPQKIADLTRGGYNQHWTRNLMFIQGGKKLLVTVGSSCNTCEESDPQRAAISIMNPDGSGKRVYASDLRNPVGLAQKPGTDQIWTVVNERDNLGDNVPPDYLTQVSDGSFHGWPYAYSDINGKVRPDPNFGDDNPAKVLQTEPPTVPVQAHSAALGVAFYPTQLAKGATAFPAAYQGDAFLAFHGSWNRSEKTGYKIVRVHFNGGKIEVSDFVRGYLKDGDAWGRPVDVQIAPDGALLFSDDKSGKIWRVSYVG